MQFRVKYHICSTLLSLNRRRYHLHNPISFPASLYNAWLGVWSLTSTQLKTAPPVVLWSRCFPATCPPSYPVLELTFKRQDITQFQFIKLTCFKKFNSFNFGFSVCSCGPCLLLLSEGFQFK